MIKAAPSALDPRALNLPKDHGGALPEAARLQNVTLALHAAASIGAVVAGLTPRQLRLASAHRGAALELLWQLTRAKFRARLAPVLRRMGEAGGGGGGGTLPPGIAPGRPFLNAAKLAPVKAVSYSVVSDWATEL